MYVFEHKFIINLFCLLKYVQLLCVTIWSHSVKLFKSDVIEEDVIFSKF